MSAPSSKKTFLDVFPVPEFLLLSHAGVTLTEDEVKFVELKRQLFGGGIRLAHLSRGDTKDIQGSLKNFAKRYGNTYISATLPEDKAYLFTATIDRVDPSGLNDAVAFILEENVPLSLAEAIFDYEFIQDDGISPKISLAVTVVSKSLVESYIKIFQAAGLMPVAFDIESRSAARAVIPKGDVGTYIIVNLTRKKTGFYVVESGVVQFSTTVNYGSDEESSTSDIRAELRKVIAFWNTKSESGSGNKKISKVLLCGAGAGDEALVARIVEGVGIEYELANVWANASTSKSHVPKKLFEEHLDFASTIGLIINRNNHA